MPQESYTNPGNYNWTAPFATKKVTATVIGGGGSGFKDCDGDDEGGGGGGGGFARAERTVNAGTNFNITVGEGGGKLNCNSRNGGNGGESEIQGGTLSVRATGGEAGYDDSGGGSAGGADAGDITNTGQRGDDDDKGGEGGGAGNDDGNSGNGSGDRPGGVGTALTGDTGSSNDGRDGGNYGGGGGGNDDGDGGRGADGAARIKWTYHDPKINSFTVTTQLSLGGTPKDTVTFTWSTEYADDVSINRGIGDVAASDTLSNYSTGLTSKAPNNSPAEKTYTLTAKGPGGEDTKQVTAQVFNDNKPSNSWTKTFTGLEPLTPYSKKIGTLSGLDMKTEFSSPDDCFFGVSSNLNGSFAGNKFYINGEDVYLKMTTLDYNTSTSGSGGFGETNTKTVTVIPGGGTPFDVSFVTKKPSIKETFDFDGEVGQYPYEDIDLIVNSPKELLDTNIVTIDDVDVDVEVKGDDPNIEVKIGNQPWQSIRQI